MWVGGELWADVGGFGRMDGSVVRWVGVRGWMGVWVDVGRCGWMWVDVAGWGDRQMEGWLGEQIGGSMDGCGYMGVSGWLVGYILELNVSTLFGGFFSCSST